MKVLVLLSCTLALVSASWIPFIGHHKEEHHPIIHDGVPIDTPEVQHARAEHLAAVAEAKAKAGYQHEEEHHEIAEESYDFGGHHEIAQGDHSGYGYSIQHIAQPAYHHHEELQAFVHQPEHIQHYGHAAYETSHQEPLIDHDGKPLDTPEVEKAKALHFAEVHKALARLQEHGHGYHSLHRRDLGDFALHVENEHHSSGYELHQNHAPVYGHHESHYHHEIPQIGHDGKPLDTAEVEHAKALHFAAHHEALARNQHASHQQHGGEEATTFLHY